MKAGIVHLYTTGPFGPDAALVQVGILALSEHPEQPRIWTLNPGRPIRRRVFEASGIDKNLVSDAPSWNTCAAEIHAALASYDTLFFLDSGSERTWLERLVLGGTRATLVDIGELAAFFLPGLDFVNLRAVCEAKVPRYQPGTPQIGFVLAALKSLVLDVTGVVLAEGTGLRGIHPVYSLLQAISRKALPFQKNVLMGFVKQAHTLHWDHLVTVPEAHEGNLGNAEMMRHFEAVLPPAETVPEVPLKTGASIQTANVDAALDALLRSGGDAMRERPAQRDYAHFCSDAFNEGGFYAAEAGTGTGKTLGYLLPAAEYVRCNRGSKVVIATATKTLQDQIVEEELPRLFFKNSPYRDLKGAKLKGKANYLCAGALLDVYPSVFLENDAPDDRKAAWLHFYLRMRFCGGTVDSISQSLFARLPELRSVMTDIGSENNCTSDLCRFGPRCSYNRHLHRALAADIVVTNHHKLATLPYPLQERIQILVVDEADQLADNLREAYREDLKPFFLHRDLVARLTGGRDRRGFISHISEHLIVEHRETDNIIMNLLTRIQEGCKSVNSALEILSDTMVRGRSEIRWQTAEHQSAGFVTSVLAHLEQLTEALDTIAGALDDLAQSPRYEKVEEHSNQSREKARIVRYHLIAAEWKERVKAIASEYSKEDFVHTVQADERGWSLSRIPYDLNEIVSGRLRDAYHTVLLTSATLYVENKLDFLLNQLGQTDFFDGNIRLRSPFDYQAHVYGAITGFLKPFDYRSSPVDRSTWLNGIVETIARLTVATEGRTLVLLTSIDEMRTVGRALEARLEAFDIEVILQNGASRAEMQRFRENEHSVLLGVDRFWYGIDFPGTTLSQVVVVRLPNPSPGEPLLQHRKEVEGNGFWSSYYHPMVRLRIRQGFGRLIRRESDRGLFVVLDPRLATKNRDYQEELPMPLHLVTAVEDRTAPLDLRRMLHDGLGVARLRSQLQDRGVDPLAC